MERIRILANEWIGTMASRVRKCILFCEPNSTPQRPIEPHEICVIPKGTAPCTNSAACEALAQFGDSLEKITANKLITNYKFGNKAELF